MDQFPDPKYIKSLAQACRKAGIKEFKCGDLWFVLGDEGSSIVEKNWGKKVNKNKEIIDDKNDKITSDTLSPEELLFWSTGVAQEAAQEKEDGEGN